MIEERKFCYILNGVVIQKWSIEHPGLPRYIASFNPFRDTEWVESKLFPPAKPAKGPMFEDDKLAFEALRLKLENDTRCAQKQIKNGTKKLNLLRDANNRLLAQILSSRKCGK